MLTQSLDFPPLEDLGTGDVVPFCIVADAAFPMKPNIIRSYPGKNLPENKRIFNYRLSRTKRVIENTFGILSSRWRIFKRPIIGTPEKAALVTKAACCLHNFLQMKNRSLQPQHHRTTALLALEIMKFEEETQHQKIGVPALMLILYFRSSPD